MSDLFAAASAGRPKPLAAELRPSSLDRVVGQSHLVAPGTLFRRRVEANRIGSLILYGPPGVGKTSIARAVGASTRKEFRYLHPARHKVEDIKKVAEEARMKDILLFVDEVHRYSATQQDHFLDLTEEGVLDFIGATTGNPFHVLAKALVSRSTVFRLEPLSVEEMERVVSEAVAHLARKGVVLRMSKATLRMLASRAGGDARRGVTAVDGLAVGRPEGSETVVTDAMVDEVYQSSPVAYDKNGDAHYDVTSAFVKSMRGSDPDATLYWLAMLIHAGEDPRYIARRILIHASEDVGLADGTALQVAQAALAAVEHVGYPEAQITLAHAALHIARAPKSNSAYRGIHLALEHVRTQAPVPVPPHLRDTHYKGAASLGAVGYSYPHADPRGWVEQDYAPGIRRGQFYQSDARGGGSFERRADDHWRAVTGREQPRSHPD